MSPVAVLAATTVLAGSAAWGQATINAATGDFEPFFTIPGSAVSAGTGLIIPVVVTDANNFGLSFPGPIGFDDSFLFMRPTGDISAPLPNDETYSVFAGAIGFGEIGQDVTVTRPTTNGEEITIVLTCNGPCPDSSISFTFDITGALALAVGPTATEELIAVLSATGGAARLVVVDAAGVARDLGQVSLATRDATGGFVRGVDGTVTASTQGVAGLVNGVYTWADITSFRSTETGGGAAEVGGSGFQIGADIAFGPDMVAGLSLGFSEINTSDGTFSQEGQVTYLQPYFSYRAGDWHGNASLIYGVGSFNQASTGGTGTADMTLTAVTFEGGYDYALAEGFTLTPTIGLLHGQQEIEGTGGTLTTSETYQFSQGSLGARISFDGPDGALFAGLHADYLMQDAGIVLVDDLLTDDGWTGRIELGGSTDLGNGLGLAPSINLSGLGGDMRTIAGGLRLAFTF